MFFIDYLYILHRCITKSSRATSRNKINFVIKNFNSSGLQKLRPTARCPGSGIKYSIQPSAVRIQLNAQWNGRAKLSFVIALKKVQHYVSRSHTPSPEATPHLDRGELNRKIANAKRQIITTTPCAPLPRGNYTPRLNPKISKKKSHLLKILLNWVNIQWLLLQSLNCGYSGKSACYSSAIRNTAR